jgi:hypothetical protein
VLLDFVPPVFALLRLAVVFFFAAERVVALLRDAVFDLAAVLRDFVAVVRDFVAVVLRFAAVLRDFAAVRFAAPVFAVDRLAAVLRAVVFVFEVARLVPALRVVPALRDDVPLLALRDDVFLAPDALFLADDVVFFFALLRVPLFAAVLFLAVVLFFLPDELRAAPPEAELGLDLVGFEGAGASGAALSTAMPGVTGDAALVSVSFDATCTSLT